MDETREAIEEALSMVKTWNKLWTPKSWIVDYAQSEISALENLFPGMNMDLYSSVSDMVPKIMLINGKFRQEPCIKCLQYSIEYTTLDSKVLLCSFPSREGLGQEYQAERI